MKLTIYFCASHDHAVGYINGELFASNDYNFENVIKLARELEWEVEMITLNGDEFEARFA